MNSPDLPEGYTVLDVLWERPYSTVYIAATKGGPVALKVFRDQRTGSPARNEMLELLTGPGLLPVLDWGRTREGNTWYATPLADALPMEGTDGEGEPRYTPHTLNRKLERIRTLHPSEVASLGRAIAMGLSRLHGLGWIHGDVKPSNIAYRNGSPVLIDYGLLRPSGVPFDSSGTPGYVPIQGSSDRGADIYALGLTLYETWTGLHRQEYPSLPPWVTSDTSWRTHGRHLNDLIEEMVRDFNPITVQQAIERLDAIIQGNAVSVRKNRSRRWAVLGVVLALVFGVGLLAALLGFTVVESQAVIRSKTLGRQFLEIPGGSFQMGRTPAESDENAPPELVTVDAFLIQRTEVPYHLWQEVRLWGERHGYTDLRWGMGKDADYPVIWIQWFDAVKWCNAWSEKEGLKPCYYTSTRFETSQVYRTNDIHIRIEWVDWSADGYRLPTEAEWEKAARGGVTDKRYFWGDTITHDNANYRSHDNVPYDLSPTKEFHPRFSATKMPFASPIASFPPNPFGLYDTSGNLLEMTWDAYDPKGHLVPRKPNPRGASEVTSGRVIKGGCWNNSAFHARPTHRGGFGPEGYDPFLGFRCARTVSARTNNPAVPHSADGLGAGK